MAHDNRNQPPASPVAAATRPPPESTDAQKDEALHAIRLQRHVNKLRKAEDFKHDEPEQAVAVMVNNGDHGGFRAIGRYFPNGLTQGVNVTEDELAELKAEPPELIRVIDASEVASIGGKGSSASLSPDEHKVLSAFRSSGQGSAEFLAHLPKTGTETSSSGSSSASAAGGEEHAVGQQASRLTETQIGKRK